MLADMLFRASEAGNWRVFSAAIITDSLLVYVTVTRPAP